MSNEKLSVESRASAINEGVQGMFFAPVGAGLAISGLMGIDMFEASVPEEALITVVTEKHDVYVTPPDLFFGPIAFSGLAMMAIGAIKLRRGYSGTK